MAGIAMKADVFFACRLSPHNLVLRPSLHYIETEKKEPENEIGPRPDK